MMRCRRWLIGCRRWRIKADFIPVCAWISICFFIASRVIVVLAYKARWKLGAKKGAFPTPAGWFAGDSRISGAELGVT
jgi:hypothetical protein